MGKNEAATRNPGATSWNKHATMHRGWPVWKGRDLIGRMTGAALRGLLVALLIATPALMLPDVASDSSQVTVLVALLAAFLTFVEYNSNSPSIVEFRNAPPFNRLRFIALFFTVFMLSAIIKGQTEPTVLTGALTSIGTIIGNAIDFPYSQVRLVVLILPENSDAGIIRSVRTSAGLAYLISLIAMTAFLVLLPKIPSIWPGLKSSSNNFF